MDCILDKLTGKVHLFRLSLTHGSVDCACGQMVDLIDPYGERFDIDTSRTLPTCNGCREVLEGSDHFDAMLNHDHENDWGDVKDYRSHFNMDKFDHPELFRINETVAGMIGYEAEHKLWDMGLISCRTQAVSSRRELGTVTKKTVLVDGYGSQTTVYINAEDNLIYIPRPRKSLTEAVDKISYNL